MKQMMVAGKVIKGRMTTMVARENGTVAGYSRAVSHQEQAEYTQQQEVVQQPTQQELNDDLMMMARLAQKGGVQ